MLNQVDERRHPRTVATVQQLLDKHLPLMKVEETTRRNYARYVAKHVTPLIGHLKVHTCEPLAAWTVRKIHFLLSGAFDRAVRWHWIGENPVSTGEPPPAPQPNLTPPTADEAARILNAAWQDIEFGTLVWTVMVTGCRRGEICRLRWRDFDAERATLKYTGSLAQDGAQLWDKEPRAGKAATTLWI